jgi:hypothetical protein
MLALADRWIDSRFPELRRDGVSASTDVLSTQASAVLANASLFSQTASRLSSLQNLQVPSADSSTNLTTLKVGIEACSKKQNELDQEVDALRARSAQCLEWWITTGVLGMGDMWEEWQYRMVDLQRRLARYEIQSKDEEGYL